MKRIVLLLQFVLVFSAKTFGFSAFYFGTQVVKWDLNYTGYNPTVFNANTKAIKFWIGSDTYSTSNRSNELNAIRASFAQWQAIPGTALKFEESGVTMTNQDIVLGDGRNLIFFSKNGIVAGKSMGSLAGLTRYAGDAEGRILEADIALNASLYLWFTEFNDANNGGRFVESIATHEIGHLLGLDHTPLGGASVIDGSPGVGTSAGLSSDEIAAARFFYPNATIGSSVGGLIGTVRMNGAAIKGAVVTAELANGIAISATASDAAGVYRLPALPVGNYNLHVSPLDASTMPVNTSLFRDIDIASDFTSAVTGFKPTENLAISVAANTTKTQDFSVIAGEPGLRVQQLSQPTALVGAPFAVRYAIGLKPGETKYLGVASTNLSADAVFTITGDGITIGPMIFEANRFYGGTMHLLQAAVTVAPNATPGLRTIVVRRGADLAYANGYFEVFAPTPDYNFDGLDDRFQRQYFSPFTAPEAAPASDPDGDHFSNAYEYATGTNPANATSFSFLIQRVDVTQAGAVVTWISDVGKQYQLYGKADVAGATWQPVGGPVTANATTTQVTDPGATGNKFYKLKLL
jgi:hypothetical protein